MAALDVPDLYQLVVQCAAGDGPSGNDPGYQYDLACAIASLVNAVYDPYMQPPTSCPPAPPPDPSIVAAAVASAVHQQGLDAAAGDGVEPSIVETAALEYAQDRYQMALAGYQVQQALCIQQGKPSVPGQPVPTPPSGGSSPTPAVPSRSPSSGAVAVVGAAVGAVGGAAFGWKKRGRRGALIGGAAGAAGGTALGLLLRALVS